MEGIVLGILLIGATMFIFRLLGAWMFRINEVITELQEIKALLRHGLNSGEEPDKGDQSDFHKRI